MKPTTIIILDTRRPKKAGKFPVKLRVTYRRNQRYYSIDKDLSKDEFLLMQNPAIGVSKIDSSTKRKLKIRLLLNLDTTSLCRR